MNENLREKKFRKIRQSHFFKKSLQEKINLKHFLVILMNFVQLFNKVVQNFCPQQLWSMKELILLK